MAPGFGFGFGFGASGGGNSAGGPNMLFGVNLSGAEYAPGSGQTFPTAANFSYLASKGVTFVRLPIAWEQLQTTLSGALATTYLNSIKAAIDNGAANGIGVMVDLHNFGAYANSTAWNSTVTYAGNGGTAAANVNFLGDGTLTQAAFVDVWTKLSTALVGRAGLAGYGLMNEPLVVAATRGTNLISTPNYFGPTPLNAWFSQNGSVATIQAAGSNPLGAGFGPAWQITSGTGFGAMAIPVTTAAVQHTLSVYAKTASGTQPLNFNNDGASIGTATVTTSWTRYSATFTPTAASHNLGLQVNAGAGNSMLVANAQLELGATPTTYVPSPYTPFAQAAVTAIRAVDATTPIYICGLGQAVAAAFTQYNYEMGTMTGGNLIFEAHQYFDGAQGYGGGGSYGGTFTSYSVDTQTGAQAVAPFLAWITATGTKGYLGEFGVPNNATDNNPQWLPTQVNFLTALQAQRVTGTQWFYGSNGIQSANALNIAPAAGVDDPRLTQMLAIR